MSNGVASAVERFEIVGRVEDIQPFGTGHIHDTYLVVCAAGDTNHHYILQRINHHVFKKPPEMMENILRVTGHIRRRMVKSGIPDVDRRVMAVIPTRDGESYFRNSDGDYWRVFDCIEGVRTYDILQNPTQAFKAARAFGHFSAMLGDLPGLPLHETIPGFHDSLKRLRVFCSTLEEDPCHRVDDVRDEIDFILDHSCTFENLAERVASGAIPIRVVHNDTKINNVLFDEKTEEALCVIDLDTVMPGLTVHDFGDLVRTSTCLAEEDEPDLSRIHFEQAHFEAIASGYFEGARDILNAVEVESLVLGGKAIVLEQAMRFLTDHLQGDVYYKIARFGHNLDRCRTQVRLYQLILEREPELNAIVQAISAGEFSSPHF